MPLYDYRCPSCSHGFELRQSFQDEAVAPCTECGANSTRVIHAPQVVYKGSGFYTTDRKKFGAYWDDRERHADEQAGREARGEAPPVEDIAGPVPIDD